MSKLMLSICLRLICAQRNHPAPTHQLTPPLGTPLAKALEQLGQLRRKMAANGAAHGAAYINDIEQNKIAGEHEKQHLKSTRTRAVGPKVNQQQLEVFTAKQMLLLSPHKIQKSEGLG